MNGFTAMFRKELTQMVRDRGTLFFALLVPVLELVLFGVIDMNAKNIPTAVLDLRMLAFALALAAATSLVFGLYPSLQASKAQLTLALRDL